MITITIDGFHFTQEETYEPREYYCPSCGAHQCYEEAGPGDYYYGPNIVCVACGFFFSIQDWNDREDRSTKIKEEL